MSLGTVERLAYLLQKIGEAYYAQGQSRVRDLEQGWKMTNPGPGPDGAPVPPLNLWMATQLLESGIVDDENPAVLDALIAKYTAAAADRSRKGK